MVPAHEEQLRPEESVDAARSDLPEQCHQEQSDHAEHVPLVLPTYAHYLHPWGAPAREQHCSHEHPPAGLQDRVSA